MKRILRTNKSLLLSITIACFGLATTASAQTYDWTGAANGNFYNTANWKSSDNTAVTFNNVTFKTVRTHGGTPNAPVLGEFIDWQPGIFDVVDGTFTVNSEFNVFFNDKLNGTITVNKGGIFTCRNIMRVGREGVGVLNVNGIARSLNTDTFQGIFIGALTNGNGTVNVNDGGLLSGGYQVEVGTRDFYPTGTLNVATGGTSEAYWVTSIGPNGTINMDGGTMNAGQVLIVGDLFLDTATSVGPMGDVVGKFNLNSGTVTVNQNDLDKPALVINAKGKMVINNGTLVIKRTGTDFTTIISDFVKSGQIAAAAGKEIKTSYDGVLTTVKAEKVAAGVADINQNSFTVFPNPAQDVITIQASNNFSGSLNVAVINVLGKTVMQQQLANASNYKLDVNQLAAGMYFVQLNNGTSTSTVKFIKK